LSPLCGRGRARRDLVAQLGATGVSVLDVGVIILGPSLVVDRVRDVLETGAALGADRVIVMNQEPDPGRAAEQFAVVCDLAGERGMRAAVEFMPYTATRSLHEGLALVRAAAAADAGVVVDVLHLHRSGGSVSELADVDPRLIHLVQLCDGRRQPPPADRLRAEALGDRLYPGDGDLPLIGVLSTLPAGIPLTVEAPVARDLDTPPADRAVAAAEAVRRMLAAAGIDPDAS
jgi:sugar phosphate isomerase/epimerase